MRAGRPILAVPRKGPTTRDHPANDQRAFLRRLAQRHPGITVCEDPALLAGPLREVLDRAPGMVTYDLRSDVPEPIGSFLATRSR